MSKLDFIKDRLNKQLSRRYNFPPYWKHYLDNLFTRIEPLLAVASEFNIEFYIEREWKELLSLYYINTTYNVITKKPGEVIRINFFDNEDNYLGFVTLRPVLEPYALLSFVYPNFESLIPLWKSKSTLSIDKDEYLYVMVYDRYVHINEQEYRIKTFPFYSQDGMVLSCAHADIVMITKFLHKRWNTPFVSLTDIISGYSFFRYKHIPSEGLNVYQMNEIFQSNNYPVIYYSVGEGRGILDISKEDALFAINSYIESGIPVLLFLKNKNENHVAVIIGHTLKGKKRSFIIYDDSGALFSWLNKDLYFINIVSQEELKKYMAGIFLYEPERVYSSPLQIREAMKHYHRELSDIPIERVFLVHNSYAKRFLHSNKLEVKEFYRNAFTNFMKGNLPHYLWAVEMIDRQDNKPIYIIADPTKHRYTHTSPFYGFIVKVSDKMSLLYGG